MGEDANRTRRLRPQVLAAVRNAAVSQLRLAGSTNIAAALRRNAARVGDLLMSSHLEELIDPASVLTPAPLGHLNSKTHSE